MTSSLNAVLSQMQEMLNQIQRTKSFKKACRSGDTDTIIECMKQEIEDVLVASENVANIMKKGKTQSTSNKRKLAALSEEVRFMFFLSP